MAGDSEGLQFASHILFVQSSPCSRIMNIHLSGGVDGTGEGGTGEGAGFMPVRRGRRGRRKKREEEEGTEKDRTLLLIKLTVLQLIHAFIQRIRSQEKSNQLSKYHPILRGTSNQYENKNTNAIELYGRITKDDTQLTYYSSGIGTYARPSWRSWKYWRQVMDNKIDLAIAWNFDRAVLAGYRWLSNHYRPGDRIFLFGTTPLTLVQLELNQASRFSCGTYQVRALAAMIDKLYADLKTHSNKGYDGAKSAEFFQVTFSWPKVKIHFLGVWCVNWQVNSNSASRYSRDLVSSVGIMRGKNLPGTDSFNHSVCYFRHALAQDERRVKFLCGRESHAGRSSNYPYPPLSHSLITKISQLDEGATGRGPRVKEVWFAGCHSDIGGGLRINDKLDNATVPVLWMGNEAQHAGLKLEPSPVEWNWEELETSKPTESLTSVWHVFELLPFKRLSYADKASMVWFPHRSEGRRIKPGQKIHASVAFIKNYKPKAILTSKDKGWHDILGKGSKSELAWTEDLRDILEMDLFDLSKTPALVEAAISDRTSFGILRFLATTREGVASIGKADSELKLFTTILNWHKSDVVLCEQSAQILLSLASYDTIRRALTWLKVVYALAAATAEQFSSLASEPKYSSFYRCFVWTHFKFASTEDLESFTANLDYSIDHIPDSDPKKSSGMLAFGEFNYILYLGHRTGIDDGVSTFEHYRRHRLPASHSKYPSAAASVYLDKVGREGLDEAIALLREVLAINEAQKGNDREIVTSLVNLADTLAVRFTLFDGAIHLYRRTTLQVENHPIPHSIAHNHLARALFEQGMQTGDFNNVLDECIQLYRDVIPVTTPPDSIRGCSLTILAAAIQKRFGREVVDEVIRLQKEAAALCLPLDLTTALDNLCDSVCNKYTDDARLPVIHEAITQFNHILGLHNQSRPLTGITLDMHYVVGEHPRRKLDRRVGNANLDDTYRKGHFRSQAGVKYGFAIRNESTKELFPYLLYFDLEKYTIDSWYTAPSTHGRPPLRSEGGIVPIGLGSERTFDFAPLEGEISTSGFLKLFVSTEYLDLEWMKQSVSPFDPGFKALPVSLDVIHEKLASIEWDSLTVVLTMSSE
ncbi:hypothetical protein B0H13DRAFT_1883251 [Mycena leptocephala]|nr:hypothetical protein B0H13DRAFT_1883251 [Mycena leptocephala]